MTPGEKILVVESDPDIADLISRQALAPLGYQPHVVSDAAAAIQQARENPPDLIITNLNLPDLSGKDLLTALTSSGSPHPADRRLGEGPGVGSDSGLSPRRGRCSLLAGT